MKFGDYDCASVELGDFFLDGGTMFGVVPKKLWEKRIPADKNNLIPMKARSLLIRGNGRIILVDAGPGSKLSEKMKRIYGIDDRSVNAGSSLLKHGLTINDITDVIITHLHFDHAGGSTARKDNKTVPAFPNAKYYIQKTQFEAAVNPGPGETSSFTADDFMPLEESGVLKILDGSCELFGGIEILVTDGHTKGQQHPLIKGKEKSLFFCADLIPTSAHIPSSWRMAYDNYPLIIIREKEEYLSRALEENWILFYEHDPVTTASNVKQDNNNIVIGKAVTL